jgi:hypothetical protein
MHHTTPTPTTPTHDRHTPARYRTGTTDFHIPYKIDPTHQIPEKNNPHLAIKQVPGKNVHIPPSFKNRYQVIISNPIVKMTSRKINCAYLASVKMDPNPLGPHKK